MPRVVTVCSSNFTSKASGAALITDPVNVSYLTGFSGDTTCLIVSRERTIIVSDGRFTDQLAEECPGLETVIRPPVEPLGEAAASTINKLGITRWASKAGI